MLFYGPDAGQISERAGTTARAFVRDPSDAFQLVRLDGDLLSEQPARLVDEATTVGLFGGRRALWVRSTGRSIAPAIKLCLTVVLVDTLVVIEGGDLQRSSPVRALCEASPRALALPCFTDDGRELGRVVDESFANVGLRLDADARVLLLESLGSDRLATRAELQKLALYVDGRSEVTVDDVEAVVSDVSAPSLDGIVDAAFGGDLSAIEVRLLTLAASGTAAGAILPAALRHVQQLTAARALMEEEGRDPEAALQSLRGLHFRRRDAVRGQLRRWNSSSLARASGVLQGALLQVRQLPALAAPLTGRTLMQIGRLAQPSRC